MNSDFSWIGAAQRSLPAPRILAALPRPQPPPLPPPLPGPRPGLSIGLAIGLAAIFVGLQIGLGLALGIPAAVLKPSPAIQGLCLMAISLGSAAGLILIALRIKRMSWREALPFARFNLWILPPLVIAVAGLHILLSEAGNALLWLMPPPAWLVRMMEAEFQLPLTAFLLVVVVAPVAEESLCRGLFLGGLLKRYRALTAVLVSAALFMAIHLNPYQFVTAFSFGILAGWIYVRTRSLWPCMIAHGLLNLVPGLLAIGAFPWEIAGHSKRSEEGVLLFQPFWFDALGVALAGLGVMWLYRTFRRPYDVKVCHQDTKTPRTTTDLVTTDGHG